MTLPSTIEEIEQEFREKEICFCGICRQVTADRAIQILRSALLRVHKETAEAMELQGHSHEPGVVPQWNDAVAAARAGLEEYRGGMEV